MPSAGGNCGYLHKQSIIKAPVIRREMGLTLVPLMLSLIRSLSLSDELITADTVDGAIQQVVSSGGQQVITIVTDGIQLGNLQTGTGISQPIIVTMPDGQQGE